MLLDSLVGQPSRLSCAGWTLALPETLVPFLELGFEQLSEKNLNTIADVPPEPLKILEALRKSFDGWKGIVDAEELKRNIYQGSLWC